jgi:hypothetical protein
VHVKSGLREYERTGIRNTRVNSTSKEAGVNRGVGVSESGRRGVSDIGSSGIIEHVTIHE